jgi:hypothetical protein
MGKARARQSTNRVSMEAATSLSGRRKAIADRGKGDLATMRNTLRMADKAKAVATLRQIAREHGPLAYKSALKLINPTYLGMDVIPEKLTDMQNMKPKKR